MSLPATKRPPQDVNGYGPQTSLAMRRLGLTADDFYKLELDIVGRVTLWEEFDSDGKSLGHHIPEVGHFQSKPLTSADKFRKPAPRAAQHQPITPRPPAAAPQVRAAVSPRRARREAKARQAQLLVQDRARDERDRAALAWKPSPPVRAEDPADPNEKGHETERNWQCHGCDKPLGDLHDEPPNCRACAHDDAPDEDDDLTDEQKEEKYGLPPGVARQPCHTCEDPVWVGSRAYCDACVSSESKTETARRLNVSCVADLKPPRVERRR